MRDILRFPARPPTPGETKMVDDWLAAAGDVAFAYVSSRRNDDPALLNRIVIGAGPDHRPSHIVHAPSGRDIWMVFSLGRRSKVGRYVTLRAALNSIRPVLGVSEPLTVAWKRNG